MRGHLKGVPLATTPRQFLVHIPIPAGTLRNTLTTATNTTTTNTTTTLTTTTLAMVTLNAFPLQGPATESSCLLEIPNIQDQLRFVVPMVQPPVGLVGICSPQPGTDRYFSRDP